MIAISYEGGMCGRDTGDAQTALTVIAGDTSPLSSIEDLEGTPARHLISVLHTKIRNLPVAIVAGPALLASAVVRIGWQVALRILSVGGSQPYQRTDEYHGIER
jgi:hypothetical protein